MKEKTLLAYRLPQAHTFNHWIHEFWPQTIMAWLLAATIILTAYGIIFGSSTPADGLLVLLATFALMLVQLAGAAVWYHYFGGTVSVTITNHGIHIIHDTKFGKKSSFASWKNVHSARFRQKHKTAVLVRKKKFLSDHLLLTAPDKYYTPLTRIIKQNVKRIL